MKEIKSRLGIKSSLTKRRFDSLIAEFNTVVQSDWKDFETKANKLCSSITNDEIKVVLSSEPIFQMAFPNGGYRDWYKGRLIQTLVTENYELGDYLLEYSEVDDVKSFILEAGVYSDLKLIDKVALGSNGKAKAMAARFCSIEALREIKNTKDKAVQTACFQRLGPVECLDEMLGSRYASVRSEGLARAPMNYSKLKDMTGEIARQPFSLLVRKIPFEYLPMLLANRNVKKNSWMQRMLEDRLNRGK